MWFRYLLLIISGPKELEYFLLRIMWRLLLGLELELLVLSMLATRLLTLGEKNTKQQRKEDHKKLLENFSELR